MVKGISRQVIVVQNTGEQLFEQAIFILKDAAIQQGVTDDILMKEAKQALRYSGRSAKRRLWQLGPVWALGGGFLVGALWLFTLLF